jgi:hypothetical protein
MRAWFERAFGYQGNPMKLPERDLTALQQELSDLDVEQHDGAA